MALKFATIALGVLHMSAALPTDAANTLEDLMMVDDTHAVGSYIRETRAAAPSSHSHKQDDEEHDWNKSVEHEGDGEIGYSRKKSGGGKKGYQHFDTFHKKAGDHYEFEKQDSYGQEEKEHDGAYSHNHEARAERQRDPEEFEDDEEERPRKTAKKSKKQRQEPQHESISHEELKEGADDGNGGIEAHGHDPSDYTLPEKYSWGEDEH